MSEINFVGLKNEERITGQIDIDLPSYINISRSVVLINIVNCAIDKMCSSLVE